MADTESTTAPFRLADGDTVVHVRKVFTRMGERAEIEAPRLGHTSRLDAIELESLTWQDADEMAERAAGLPDGGSVGDAPDGPEREDAITVSNEFALAELSVESGGDRLSIRAPKLGYDAEFGVRELEWVAGQDHETFTGFLETPFGPDAAEDHH